MTVIRNLVIVENGMGNKDVVGKDGTIHDDYRIDYLRSHIIEMKKAVEIDQIPLLGYTTWGCVDIVSAGTGEMAKRYGFVYVDLDDKGNGTSTYEEGFLLLVSKVIASNGNDIQ